MKREGRQHGMVRTYRVLPTPMNPRPETRFAHRLDSPSAAGLFSRVQSKPTNHSKFTGKCALSRCNNACHVTPACKARDKAKGSHKTRSHDVVSNYRLVTWRVVDVGPGLINFSGVSASRILDHLSSYDLELDDDYHDLVHDDDEHDHDHDRTVEEIGIEDEIGGQSQTPETVNGQDHGHHEDEDEEEMSFCDVGFVLQQDEDGWCVVEEL